MKFIIESQMMSNRLPLKNKKILLGVTGGIAAYKAAFLVRLLIKEKAEVQVIMTESAQQFITPLTLSTLSKKEVKTDWISGNQWNNHVELGKWADLFIIAPLSLHSLGKMANGLCDNLLLATYFSAKCPVLFAPAMDLDMYKHPTTTHNIEKLISYGNLFIEPQEGDLASGLVGKGRMAEPQDIMLKVHDFFNHTQPLNGKKVLISAGPTHEKIDPVRFLGNRSTGKMGYALAEQACNLGAQVTLVSGPSYEKITENKQLKKIEVISAQEMFKVIESCYKTQDIVIMAAAVADYRPKKKAAYKIKKQSNEMSIELERTPDILKVLGEKKQHQLLVGFALETDNEEQNALEKLKRKNLDYIVLNSLKEKGAGPESNTNKVIIFNRAREKKVFALKSKKEVALDILNTITKK